MCVHIQTPVHRIDRASCVVLHPLVCLGDLSRPEYVRLQSHFKLLLHIPYKSCTTGGCFSISITKGSEDPVWLRLFSVTQNSAYLHSSERTEAGFHFFQGYPVIWFQGNYF